MASSILSENNERTEADKKDGSSSIPSSDSHLSPKEVHKTKSHRTIQMVTSTPLLKNTETTNLNRDNPLAEKTNFLFHTGASVVKHYSNNIRKDRLLLTPNIPQKADISIFSTIHNVGGGSNGDHYAESRSIFKDSIDAHASAECPTTVQPPTSEIPDSEKSAVNIVPKILRFETSPQKENSKNQHSSVDMFVNMSTVKEDLSTNSAKDHVSYKKNLNYSSVQFIEPFQQSFELQKVSTNRESACNKQPKETNVQFRIPNIMSQPNLIPIRKGGKNWRRTIVLPSKRPTSIEGNSRESVPESKTMVRKSSIKIETKRSTISLKNEPIPQINEISIMDISAFQDEVNEKNPKVHTDTDNSPNNINQTSFNISLHANKSASYIVPIAGKCNESILAVSTIDTVTKVLSKCSEKTILPFNRLCNEQVLSSSKKVGEGSYGEVFLLNINDLNPSVLKIVPVDGNALVNGEPQTKLSDMLAEIVVSTDLTLLQKGVYNRGLRFEAPNFICLRNCNLVEGEYPERLLELWDEYHEIRESENERPDTKLFNREVNHDVQRFVAIEYENGGQDLETIVMNNASQGLSIFLQVAYSIAGKCT